MSNYNFGRDAFRVWLRKNPNSKFRRQDSCACPLAAFAKKGCGYKGVSVDQDEITLNGITKPAKPWMTKFIETIDDGNSSRVSGREAYRVLNRISRGPNG